MVLDTLSTIFSLDVFVMPTIWLFYHLDAFEALAKMRGISVIIIIIIIIITLLNLATSNNLATPLSYRSITSQPQKY